MKISVVIADDHSIFIDGMKALLNEVPGIEVTGSALNGEQAVMLAQKLRPDVLLMDIQMPLKNGIEATKEIVRLSPGTKVIALSMLNEGVNTRKMMEAGAYGYVLKTIDKDELLSVIRKVAGGDKHFNKTTTEQLAGAANQSPANHPAALLTRREKEILVLIAQGLTDKEIAEKIFLSPHTIIAHRKNILSKLGLKNKVEIARFAMDWGIM